MLLFSIKFLFCGAIKNNLSFIFTSLGNTGIKVPYKLSLSNYIFSFYQFYNERKSTKNWLYLSDNRFVIIMINLGNALIELQLSMNAKEA